MNQHKIARLLKGEYRPALDVIGRLWKADPEIFYTESRKIELVKCRHFFHKALKDSGLSYPQLVKLTGYDHSSLVNSVKQAMKMIETDVEDKALYNIAYSTIEHMDTIRKLVDEHYKKEVYLAGKISGLPVNETREKFLKAERFLMKSAKSVLNPFKYCEERNITGWTECMKALVPELLKREMVVALEDSKDSMGALWEIGIAKSIARIPIVKLRV